MEDTFGNIVVKSGDAVVNVTDLKYFISGDNEVYNEYDVGEIYYPKGGITLPSKKNYSQGYMFRYFCRQINRNNSMVLEISKTEYSVAKSHYLYKTLEIKWKLIGNKESVIAINSNIINIASATLPGINNTLWNPLQFWKDVPDIITMPTNVTSNYVNIVEPVKSFKVVEPIIL